MKSHITPLAIGLCALALASCAGTQSKKKDAEELAGNAPGSSRYIQDNSQPSTTGNTPANPDATTPAPADNAPATPPKPPENNPTANTPPTPPPPSSTPSNQYPYGKPVPGKKGFVYSPYTTTNDMIDVRDYAPGTKVRDPFTQKIFLVP